MSFFAQSKCILTAFWVMFAFNAVADEAMIANSFPEFYQQFKAALKSNNQIQMAKLVHFPLDKFGKTITKEDFLSDKKEGTVNIFVADSKLRKTLLNVSLGEISSYSSKSELDEIHPGCNHVPVAGSLIEVDAENSHGGPALIFVFAKQDKDFKLFCVTQ